MHIRQARGIILKGAGTILSANSSSKTPQGMNRRGKNAWKAKNREESNDRKQAAEQSTVLKSQHMMYIREQGLLTSFSVSISVFASAAFSAATGSISHPILHLQLAEPE
eukprot:752073-Hanusia_phi.AAC.3